MVCRMRDRGTDSTSGPDGAVGGAAGPGVGLGRVPVAMSASMSSLVMRPSGPLPRTVARSMACSAASFRASGETFNRSVASVGAAAAGAEVGRAGPAATGAGAGAGCAARADRGRGWTFCPGAPITAMLAPTGALFPSSTRISSRTPPSSASISTLTLSVSISAMASPLAMGSPGRFFQFRTFPSVIASPIFGMMTSATGLPSNYGTGDLGLGTRKIGLSPVPSPWSLVPPLFFSERLLHSCDNVRLMWHRPYFQGTGVRHGHIGAGDAFDRPVQLIERIFINSHRNFSSGSEWLPLFLDDHGPVRTRHRLHHARHVEWSQRPEADHLGLDALASELLRRGDGRMNHPAVGDDRGVAAAPHYRGLPKGQGKIRIWYLSFQPVQRGIFQEDHGILAADRRAEQSLRLRRRGGRNDIQAGEVRVGGLQTLRVLRGQLHAGAVGAADDQRNVDLSAGEVAQLGGVVHDLVHRQQGEVPGHDFHHRPQSEHRHPNRRPHEPEFGNGGVDHARRAIPLERVGGNPY